MLEIDSNILTKVLKDQIVFTAKGATYLLVYAATILYTLNSTTILYKVRTTELLNKDSSVQKSDSVMKVTGSTIDPLETYWPGSIYSTLSV